MPKIRKMIKNIEEILVRDLNSLKNEVLAFKNDKNLWETRGEIKNSAGALAQHLCGNLRHFIGATLGNSGYIRNRDLEFSQRDINRDEIIRNVEETIVAVKKTLSELKEDELLKTYPLPFLGKEVKTGELLLILTTHLGYHLGQINYLRRSID